jgi:GDP/UDP-N,N'-diacetylbacillosamine 2-epimerase (hydrolysing)
MQGIKDAPDLELQIIATGMHLAPEFGSTFNEIEADGFHIDRRVAMLTGSDTPVGIAKAMGIGMSGFADALDQLEPDLLLVLGDRFEILSAVAAAMVARIPIAHLHGGELTEGLIDEAIRHAVTKMSHLHFVATDEYRRRVIQLGEAPERVFTVGGLGVDTIRREKLLSRDALEEALDMAFGPRNLLVTFHPVTLETATAESQMGEVLAVLAKLEDTQLIMTMPNADTESRILFRMIEDFAVGRPNVHVYTSLGSARYLSCIAQVDGVLGNSSSGLTEVPTFKKGTINIGDRQRGRLMADSVINCRPDRRAIAEALDELHSSAFREKLRDVRNPYGDGGASERIVAMLRSVDLTGILKKTFYDLK